MQSTRCLAAATHVDRFEPGLNEAPPGDLRTSRDEREAEPDNALLAEAARTVVEALES